MPLEASHDLVLSSLDLLASGDYEVRACAPLVGAPAPEGVTAALPLPPFPALWEAGCGRICNIYTSDKPGSQPAQYIVPRSISIW